MKKKIIVQSFLLLNQKPSSFRLSQKTPSTYFQHAWSESFILMNLDDEFFLGLDSQKRIELLPIRRRIPRSPSTIRPYLLSREIQPDTHHLMLPQIQVNKHNVAQHTRSIVHACTRIGEGCAGSVCRSRRFHVIFYLPNWFNTFHCCHKSSFDVDKLLGCKPIFNIWFFIAYR